MRLVHFRLFPKGSWRTPWQADTLMGALAAAAARVNGPAWLEEELLDPWRSGEPPFVLSDACPEDFLPAPALLPLLGWPEAERKRVKRAAWLTPQQFAALQRGETPILPPAADPGLGFARSDAVIKPEVRLRNTLDRCTDTTGTAGSLYPVEAEALAGGVSYLSLYARIAAGKESILAGLLQLLSETGFGADVSAGFGHFELAEKWEDAGRLDAVTGADGWISLSTFQPSPRDSTDGYWRSFVKYGKLGPDFSVEDVFKRPQWMLRPGACFHSPEPIRDWYGRLISPEDLLADSTRTALESRGIRPVQPAFALAVPIKWATQYEV